MCSSLPFCEECMKHNGMLPCCAGLFVVDYSCIGLHSVEAQGGCYAEWECCPRTTPESAAAFWIFPLMHVVTRHLHWLSGILADFGAFPPPPSAASSFSELGRQVPRLAESVSHAPPHEPRRYVHKLQAGDLEGTSVGCSDGFALHRDSVSSVCWKREF